jgi:hypothetical protein
MTPRHDTSFSVLQFALAMTLVLPEAVHSDQEELRLKKVRSPLLH